MHCYFICCVRWASVLKMNLISVLFPVSVLMKPETNQNSKLKTDRKKEKVKLKSTLWKFEKTANYKDICPVPAGINRPTITFSFKPVKKSTRV